MPRSRRTKKPTQSRSSRSQLAPLSDRTSKADTFISHAKNAEKAIRENYGTGRIPPDWCGDGWDDAFALAYKDIRGDLPQVFLRHYQSPPGTAYRSFPFEAENPVEAWMFLLNPADEAFGEPGYLESSEYLEIKTSALSVLHYILNPPLEHILTDIEAKIVKAMTDKPQTAKMIAAAINCEEQTVRKYAPGLCERGLIMKAPKNGYYKIT